MGECSAGAIGGMIDQRHPARRHGGRFLAALGKTAHGQRIGKPSDAKTQPALGARFLFLDGERIVRDVDDVVHEAYRMGHEFGQPAFVDMGMIRERIVHQSRQVHRAQQASAIGRQYGASRRAPRLTYRISLEFLML